MTANQNVALIGAGVIADTHAAILSQMDGAVLTAVIDANPEAAAALAKKYRIPHTAGSLDDIADDVGIDSVHILTPPPTHAAVARDALARGYHIFSEKPLAASAVDAAALVADAEERGLHLGVNQNFLFNLPFKRLLAEIVSGRVGRPVQVQCHFSMPLRQLDAGQFGHWMFDKPLNILLEQAVHPLSQIARLTGEIHDVTVQTGTPRMLTPELPFFDRWQISLAGETCPAQLSLSLGHSLPVWRLSVVCNDGTVSADMIRDRIFVERRSRWPDFADHLLEAGRSVTAYSGQSLGNAANYILSTLKLRARTDPFFVGMNGSIRAFHTAVASNRAPDVDGAFGASLVALAERIVTAAAIPPRIVSSPACLDTAGTVDTVLLGGTGFIGEALLRQLLDQGQTVAVMARSVGNLGPLFRHPNVRLIKGDVTFKPDIVRAVQQAKWVVNLAHGGGGDSWQEVRRRMVDSALAVAEVAAEAGVQRLIHISSIAALYLGDPRQTITGSTATDPQAGERADYSRGKAVAEAELTTFAEAHDLEICILRPGVVVGSSGIAMHSAFGFYNNDGHCIGWNLGKNPLPFVLVDDVASAISAALSAPDAAGKCYNLVGDVTPNARDYLAEMAKATGRPITYHPQPVPGLQSVEIGKWVVKRLIGRHVAFPSYRDLKSRGLAAQFDCSDAKQDLAWQPEPDLQSFYRRALPAAAQTAENSPGQYRSASDSETAALQAE